MTPTRRGTNVERYGHLGLAMADRRDPRDVMALKAPRQLA
jgi:hypothetical protein